MTTLREAAQQALEALEGCVKALDALHAPGDSIYTRASDLADRAEIALRAALAQQEQEPVAWRFERLNAVNQELLEVLVSFTKSGYIKKQHPKRYAAAVAAIAKAEGEKP